MAVYYSGLKRGFYHSQLHDDMPPDAVLITDDEYTQLLDGQATGKIIAPDSAGKPVLQTPG